MRGNLQRTITGGLRLTLDTVECLLSHETATDLLCRGLRVDLTLRDPECARHGFDPGCIGHIVSSRGDGAETEHLMICVYPDRVYATLKTEAWRVWRGELDICKVVCVKASEVAV